MKKLKYLAKIKSGDSIINSNLSDEYLYEVFGGNGFMGYFYKYNVSGENIIIGRVGALCGNIRYINEEKWITDNALILNLINLSKTLYSYVSYVLECANLNTLSVSNAQPLITGTKIMNILIAIPPLSEQKQIIDYLDKQTAKIDQAIALKTAHIEKLKEYKSVLINDVVTGKVRV